MSVSATLREFLARRNADYEIIEHPRTGSAMRTAEVARVPGEQMVKGVIVEDEQGYLMAVLPATHRLDVGKLSHLLGRRLGLATEPELGSVFADCELGSVPPVGGAFGIDSVMDQTVAAQKDVYFESGDHGEVIHMGGDAYRRLLGAVESGAIGHHI